ncbi:hypothetical protein BHM03_00026767 [Ensete ventricosum]|nr:hypothetical protein BHM03_00026767 [Ensete ventricosum]
MSSRRRCLNLSPCAGRRFVSSCGRKIARGRGRGRHAGDPRATTTHGRGRRRERSGKAPYQAIHTGMPANRYTDRPLPGGTTKIVRRHDKALYQAVCTNPSADRNKREKNTLHTTLPRFPHTVRHLRAKNCPRDLRPRAIPSPHAGRRNIILHYIPSIMHCAYRLVPGTVLYRDTYRSAS